MPDPAPATLRVVSAALLGGGALAGFAPAAVTSRRLLPALALGVAGLILTIARADRRPPVSRRVISPPSPAGSEASVSPTRDRLTFSILVAARDEAVVLPPTGSTLDARARLRRSLAVGLFNAVGLAVVPGALVRLANRRGPVEYAKMVHVGAVDRG